MIVRVEIIESWLVAWPSRYVEFFDVGVVSGRQTKRFNDYYFQVNINFVSIVIYLTHIVLFPCGEH